MYGIISWTDFSLRSVSKLKGTCLRIQDGGINPLLRVTYDFKNSPEYTINIQVGSIYNNSIVRRTERSHRSAAVQMVTPKNHFRKLCEISLFASGFQFPETAQGTNIWTGVQKELESCSGENHGPHITPFHNKRGRFPQLALCPLQVFPDGTDRCKARSELPHILRSDFPTNGNFIAKQNSIFSSSFQPKTKIHTAGQQIGRSQLFCTGAKTHCHGSEHGSSIQIGYFQDLGDTLGKGRFANTSRAVQCNDGQLVHWVNSSRRIETRIWFSSSVPTRRWRGRP